MGENNKRDNNIIFVKDKNEVILCILIKSDYSDKGIKFFTPNDFSQQLAYMKRPKGYKIKPHFHKKNQRTVNFTQEVLVVKSGEVKVNLYDNENIFFQSLIVKKGDVILLASGGHSFEFNSESELIEVKQGPYSDEDDKVIFSNQHESI